MRAVKTMAAVLLWSLAAGGAATGRLFDIDRAALVSRADLHYDKPATRSEEGMPVGNGRMGTLVWTTPAALRMQINRNDVFATDSRTHSFLQASTEYGSGCAYLDVQLADSGPDVFTDQGFEQHLSVYDGVCSVKGKGVTARVLVWHERDVMAIEIEDRRPAPQPIQVDLRMLRYANPYLRGTGNDLARRHAGAIVTNAHTALMRLSVRDDGRVALMQEFREGEYYCASAVAIAVVGREAKASYYNDSTVRLSAAPSAAKFTILIAAAATFDAKQDVEQAAVANIDAIPKEGFEPLLEDNRAWWRDFWSRSFVRLHSDDGQADEIEKNYNYFLYVMASSSRGEWPARFGGMLWYTNGDMRAWGSLFWWANQSCYYNGLAPSNHPELVEPMLALYTRIMPACEEAAKQQWGSRGLWIPETTFFNGPEPLPPDIAAEMRELYLLRKPWEQRSEAFTRYAQTVCSFSSRWNWMAQGGHFELGRWIADDKGHPPFGHVTHIFGTTAKIAHLFWERYEYTLDRAWLRDRAYPMLKGTVEFYRNFPNLRKESDGKYHLYHTNSNEPAWGVKDSDEDLSALRGTIGPLVRASEILDVDSDMRPVWREFLQNLASIPTTDDADALKPDDYTGPRTFAKGRRPAIKAGGVRPDGNTLPQWSFELCHLESADAAMLALANSTFDSYFRGEIGPETRVGTLSRLPIAAAQLGRAEAVRYLLTAQLRAGDAARGNAPGIMRNRMALREGPGATECERLGRVAEALHAALLHSAPPTPGGEAIVRVFPAWPKEWEAQFTLLARGNFLVSASMKDGVIGPVKFESRSGGELRLRNPWPGKTIAIRRSGAASVGEIAGDVLKIPTDAGEIITLSPRDVS
jgi:hypothetical protein